MNKESVKFRAFCKICLLIILMTFISFPAFSAMFNNLTGLMETPTADTVGHLNFEIGFFQSMVLNAFEGEMRNTDWIEDDGKVMMGFRLEQINLDFELGLTQYSWVQTGGDYGVGNLKIRFFQDPLNTFFLPEDQISLKGKNILPSIALGVKNIAGNGMKYVTEVGIEGEYVSNNSVYLVFSKILAQNTENAFKVHLGGGNRCFVGHGRNKSPGLFYGFEVIFDRWTKHPMRMMLEFSGVHYNLGYEFSTNWVKLSLGVSHLENFRKKEQEAGLDPMIQIGITITPSSIRHYNDYQQYLSKRFLEKGREKLAKKEPTKPEPEVKPEPVKPEPEVTPVLEVIPKPVEETIPDLFAKINIEAKEVESGISLNLKGVKFAPGKANLASESYNLLNNTIEIIKKYPEYNLILEGHTDNQGNDKSNFNLSVSRVMNVKNYILDRLGATYANRIISFGFGEEYPIANNKTSTGRKANRRVEMFMVKPGYWNKEVNNREYSEQQLQEKLLRIEQEKSRMEELYSQAKSKENSGDISGARSIYEKLATQDINPSVRKKAIRSLAAILLKLGTQAIKSGNTTAGENYLKEVGKYSGTPSYDNAMFLLGEIRFNKGNYSSSIIYYKKVRSNYRYFNKSEYDKDDEATLRIINAYVKLGNLQKALSEAEKSLKNYPNSKLKPNFEKIVTVLKTKVNN